MVVDLVDGGERGQIDHYPGRHLRLPQSAVTLSAGGDLDAVPAGEADHANDVGDRARLQHGPGPAMDRVAEVVGGGGQAGVVEEELAVEVRKTLRRSGAATGELRRRDPALQGNVEAGDGGHGQRARRKFRRETGVGFLA